MKTTGGKNTEAAAGAADGTGADAAASAADAPATEAAAGAADGTGADVAPSAADEPATAAAAGTDDLAGFTFDRVISDEVDDGRVFITVESADVFLIKNGMSKVGVAFCDSDSALIVSVDLEIDQVRPVTSRGMLFVTTDITLPENLPTAAIHHVYLTGDGAGFAKLKFACPVPVGGGKSAFFGANTLAFFPPAPS